MENQGSVLMGGQWVAGEGPSLISTTPDESRELWQKSVAGPRQVKSAVEAARAAFTPWSGQSSGERLAVLQRFAAVLSARRSELARAIALETGKPLWEADGEVSAMIAKVGISAEALNVRAGSWQREGMGLSHRGHGVMAVFGPFNFPGHLPNGHIVPALLAGNTVVFKPSEWTPWVAELTAHCWLEAGLPDGVLNLVPGGREVGETLAAADIDGLLFTGSSNVGKALHKQMGGRPEVLMALEMGGNNPLIVGAIKAPTLAAEHVFKSAFLSAGQRCTCARRLILVRSDGSQRLVAELIALTKRVVLQTPDGLDRGEEGFMGPVIHTQAAEALIAGYEALISAGARPLLEIKTGDAPVYLYPGILDVGPVSERSDEEMFGPLLQVEWVDNFDQALRQANATRYGLAAGLMSDDPEEQRRFTAEIRAGVISINQPTAGASSRLPFGGVGRSGNHRPSAYYAADYCVWPQAQSLGEPSDQQTSTAIRGLT